MNMNEPKLRFKADDGSDYPEWNDFTKLEDISAFITKGATPTTYGFDWQPNGVYFFRNDCIKNNVFVYGDYSFIAEEANKFLQRSEVTGGDIVIAITGDIGKVGLIPSEVKKANINQHLARVRIVKDAFPYFVYMYLCSDKVQRTYKKIKTGLSMPQLSLAQIRDTNIPVVSLPEQQKIADFLSTIDTVIAKQKETVSAWEERKKGVMQKLFSQEVRFKADNGSDFPEWEEKKISECTKFVKDGTHGTHKNVSNGHPLLSAKDIFDNIVHIPNDSRLISDEDYNKIFSKYDLQDGDVLITIVGTLGRTALVTDTCKHVAFQRSVGIMRPDKSIVDSNYLKAVCDVAHFQNELEIKKNKGAQAGVYLGVLSSIEISVPCLEEQQKIADCLSSLDEVIEKQKATLAAWEALKKGLLQQMFV